MGRYQIRTVVERSTRDGDNKIDNADELLGIFVDTFIEESYPVSDVASVEVYCMEY